MLKIADSAPDFTLPSVEGGDITLSSLRPSPVVLFFYPRDNTPGCTLEARAFSALLEDFKTLGAQIFGISKDSLKKHSNFRTKQGLTVPLLSDAQGKVCQDYGVWGEKKLYGKVFLGIIRTTVLIDSSGKVASIWPKVKVEGHAEDVLNAVRAL